MTKQNEQVLVVRAEDLEPFLPHFKGGLLTQDGILADALTDLLGGNAAFFMDRARAEQDARFKQLIPYTVLSRRPGARVYFGYQRTKKAGDRRLHTMLSLGVGGHINPADGEGGFATYENAFLRELDEELSFTSQAKRSACQYQEPQALIYDPSNEVGRVHLGVIHMIRLDDDVLVTPHDPALAEGQWFTPGGLRSRYVEFENWSRMVIDSLILSR
jgi:predicted NUDIX family phosphoesterase